MVIPTYAQSFSNHSVDDRVDMTHFYSSQLHPGLFQVRPQLPNVVVSSKKHRGKKQWDCGSTMLWGLMYRG